MKLHLRDYFWLLLVIGLALCLWRERARYAELEYAGWQWRAESLAKRWRQVGGEVEWIDTGNGNGWGAIYTDPDKD